MQHLHQVALARAEEAAHPDARLFRLIQVSEVGREDSLQAVGILAIADEIADLVAERVNLRSGLSGRDLGHPVVQEAIGAWVLIEELAVEHHRSCPSLLVIGIAR